MSVQTTSVKVEDATPGSAIRVNLSKIIRGGDDVNVYGTVVDPCHIRVDALGGEVVSVRSELEVEVFGDVVVSAAE